MSTNQP